MVEALTRIFKLCDKDKDGALSNAEPNDFQARVVTHNEREFRVCGLRPSAIVMPTNVRVPVLEFQDARYLRNLRSRDAGECSVVRGFVSVIPTQTSHSKSPVETRRATIGSARLG